MVKINKRKEAYITMGKKFFAYVMSLLLLLNTFVPIQGNMTAYAANAPLGVTDHWAQKYLENLFMYGIMRGDQDGNMNPDIPITRAEFVSMVNRAFGYREYQKTGKTFSDVKPTAWYADDIAIAKQQGYFAGITPAKAEPGGYLTREQAVALLCRNIKLEEKQGEILGFTDSRQFGNWSKGSIGAFLEKGYIAGYKDSTFRPKAYISRGEAAKIISDIIGKWISKAGTYRYGTVQGNLMLTNSGITLEDTVIVGDLYITSGVGSGYVNLNNVNVTGDVIISGGGSSNIGENSINFHNCHINRLIVDGQEEKVIAVDTLGTTVIAKTIVKTRAFLENHGDYKVGFIDVELRGSDIVQLTLAGDFDKVTVKNPKNQLKVGKGYVRNLYVDEDATESSVILDKGAYIGTLTLETICKVTGLGDISTLVVNANGCEVDMWPDKIVIRPGFTVKIDGKDFTSSDAEQYSAEPRILAGYPKEDEIGSSKATMKYKTNKSGQLYWVITFEEYADDVKEEHVLEPKKGKHIIASGNAPIKEAEKEILSTINGLSKETQYTISSMLVDVRNETSRLKATDFKTVDDTIPAFVSGYPKVSSNDSTKLDIAVAPSKKCTVYWAVFPQGNAAPTAQDMKKDKIAGALASGKQSKLKPNIEKILTASGLKEKTKYDVYVLLSDGERDSKVSKVTATTKDTTPPEFINGYPRQWEATEKNIDVNVKINEDGIVYWVLEKKGTEFPPPYVDPDTNEVVKPSIDSEAASNAVITGNNAFKKGKTNAKENQEVVLKLSGLEEQTNYDLYVVAQDASKNASKVKHITVKTKDTIPPEASLKFSEDVEGRPSTKADITIWFNEEVWDYQSKKTLTPQDVKKNVTLYSLVDSNENKVAFDENKIEIGTSPEGKSFIKFTPESLNLHSGTKYVFELSGIVDTSNNRMKDGYRDNLHFETVPPLVQLTKLDDDGKMDIIFRAEPQESDTEETVLYDMVLESDLMVRFELYQRNMGQTDWGNALYEVYIDKNSATTLGYEDFEERRKTDSNARLEFEKFSTIPAREYGIKMKSINGVTDRGSWNQKVTLRVKAAIGSYGALSKLAATPTDWAGALEEGVTAVHNPGNFFIVRSFLDTTPPKFRDTYPRLGVPAADGGKENEFIGDTWLAPQVMTDKKATMYYLVALEGSVTDDTLTPEKLMSGNIKPKGSVWGTYDIVSGDALFDFPIQGLEPEKDYRIWYCLKGAAPTPSKVEFKKFRTKAITVPKLDTKNITRQEDSVDVNVRADRNASIQWILMPDSSAVHYLKKLPDGNYVVDPDKEAGLKQKILEAKVGDEAIIDAGGALTVWEGAVKDYPYSAKVSAKNMDKNLSYTFFAIGRATLDDNTTQVGEWSTPYFTSGIRTTDKTPPDIIVKGRPNKKLQDGYSGDILITFTEPVYYVVENQDNIPEAVPLTPRKFYEDLAAINCRILDPQYFSLVRYTTATGADDGPMTSIQFKYADASSSSNIVGKNLVLCDKNVNVAGRVSLDFSTTQDPEGDLNNPLNMIGFTGGWIKPEN